MGSMAKGSVATVAVLLGSEVLYRLYLRWAKRQSKSKSENESSKQDQDEIMDVFFFPDKVVACKMHFLGDSPCFKDNCKYSHEKTSLSELYRHLSSCRRTMDVCVFVLTCTDLADILITMHHRGVVVRIITDDEQINISGSQIWRFRKEGIVVRTDSSSFYMHHKFVVIDNRLVINGSFNWTRKAVTGNQENVIVTNNSKIAKAFMAEFEKLWEQFDPRKQSGNLHLSSSSFVSQGKDVSGD